MHALWPHCVHARVGRYEHTVAWLSASICQFVFMFEGSDEARLTATRRSNSWSFTGDVVVIVQPPWTGGYSTDGER